jgi:hypothetical protein
MLPALTAFRSMLCRYCRELATDEKMLLAWEPMSCTVPTTITRITASMTAYSAISCPFSSDHSRRRPSFISCPPHRNQADRQSCIRRILCNFVRNLKSTNTNSFGSKINNLQREWKIQKHSVHHTARRVQTSDKFLHTRAYIVPSVTLVFRLFPR